MQTASEMQGLIRLGIFQLKETFNVTQRGIVGFGYFIEGVSRIGSRSMINIGDKQAQVKIVGIEIGNPLADGPMPFGLLFQFENKILEKSVEDDGVAEQLIEIYKCQSM